MSSFKTELVTTADMKKVAHDLDRTFVKMKFLKLSTKFGLGFTEKFINSGSCLSWWSSELDDILLRLHLFLLFLGLWKSRVVSWVTPRYKTFLREIMSFAIVNQFVIEWMTIVETFCFLLHAHYFFDSVSHRSWLLRVMYDFWSTKIKIKNNNNIAATCSVCISQPIYWSKWFQKWNKNQLT